MSRLDKYKPAVSRNVLLFLAGLLWVCVGAMLLLLAVTWLSRASHADRYLCGSAGVIVGLLAHHLGFLRIVDRNLERLLPMDDKKCLFAFIPWQSYLVIAVMITLGVLLRHSAIPKPYLAIVYLGVGLALLLSSVRYLRIFVREMRR